MFGLFNFVKLGILRCTVCAELCGMLVSHLSEQKALVAGRSGLGWVMLPSPDGAPVAAPVKGTNKVQQGTHVNRGSF